MTFEQEIRKLAGYALDGQSGNVAGNWRWVQNLVEKYEGLKREMEEQRPPNVPKKAWDTIVKYVSYVSALTMLEAYKYSSRGERTDSQGIATEMPALMWKALKVVEHHLKPEIRSK